EGCVERFWYGAGVQEVVWGRGWVNSGFWREMLLLGIFVNGGPEETGIKDLLGGEVSTTMSPRGSIVASFKNVESFLPIGGRPLGSQLLSCQEHRNQTLGGAEPTGAISP
nr:hypothetical protein [Tanacetum cinerariifolium]